MEYRYVKQEKEVTLTDTVVRREEKKPILLSFHALPNPRTVYGVYTVYNLDH